MTILRSLQEVDRSKAENGPGRPTRRVASPAPQCMEHKNEGGGGCVTPQPNKTCLAKMPNNKTTERKTGDAGRVSTGARGQMEVFR